jgi:hypothetical protein
VPSELPRVLSRVHPVEKTDAAVAAKASAQTLLRSDFMVWNVSAAGEPAGWPLSPCSVRRYGPREASRVPRCRAPTLQGK